MERFSLTLMPDKFFYFAQVDWHLPTFETFLRPILTQAKDCYVYGLSDENKNSFDRSVFIKDRGKYRLDITKEVITGFETLWNGSYPDRGSIVIILEPDKIDLASFFPHCFDVTIFDNPNTGLTPGAVKYCKKQVEQGFVSLCFYETNGFEWVSVFAPKEMNLSEKAIKYCGTKIDITEWEKFKKPKRKLPGTIGR